MTVHEDHKRASDHLELELKMIESHSVDALVIYKNNMCPFLFVCLLSRQGFSVASKPILEQALVNQTGLTLI